jgi:uncharacterized repeat protein (TIGR01451 family)
MNNLPIEIHRALVFVIAALTILAVVSSASANGLSCGCGNLCVNETGWWRAGHNFNASDTPIQAAVDNATAGETICVRDGTYSENVLVNKQLTIRSENGPANCIVIENDANYSVFKVIANWVNITGLTVQNATLGIYLDAVEHCNISDNNATNNSYGIQLNSSSNNTLSGNIANSNGNDGIHLFSSANNNLINNTASSNVAYGIYLWHSSNNNTVTGNTANSNKNYGIYLTDWSNNNTLTGNTATSNEYDGIYLFGSQDNNLTGNTANSNGNDGIYLDQADNNNLTGNIANENAFGVYLDQADNNNLTGNTANSNDDGIYLWESSNNTLTNNTATSNHYDGILLDSSSNNNELTGNTATSNEYDGILLFQSDNNNLTGNIVTDNEVGIYLYSASWNTITCNAVYKNIEAGFRLEYDSVNNTIEKNGIVANFRDEKEGYNFHNGQDVAVNATSNYWGTTVSEEIAARIYEGFGEVTYEPFLYEWPPCAPGVPVLGATKTVWNGTAWVTEVWDAHLNDTLRFNCTITNVGGVNLTQVRFWDILDCSLVFADNATLKNATGDIVNDSIVLEGKYTFKPKVLHPIGYLNLSNPEGTFEELCPESQNLASHAWNDTDGDGNLSTCDQIQLGNPGGSFWAHVDHMPYTLNVTNNETGESMYLESCMREDYDTEQFEYADYEGFDLGCDIDMIDWLEVGWTAACCGGDWYNIAPAGWNDTDEDGKLSVNDTIRFEEGEDWYTITEVAIDLVVSREWEVDDFADPEGLLLEPGQSLTIEYNATDIRCGWDENTFVAKGLYEGNWTYSNEGTAIVEVPPWPAVETNLTVWNGTAWAKEVTVLVNDTLNFSWLVHNNGTCCDLGDIVGTLTFASNETTVDNIESLAPCSEANGTLEVPALECGTYTVRWNVSADCWEAEETVTAEDTVTVTVACPELEVDKTVWNGTAWVKAVDAKLNDTLQFNCTIQNTGNVNLSEIRFWDILDCSLVYEAGSGWVKTNGDNESLGSSAYLFKPEVRHPEEEWNLSDPYGSYFIELCPEEGQVREIEDWVDQNHDGNVSPGDQIAFFDGQRYCWFHVDRVPYTLNLSNANGSTYFDSVLDWSEVNRSNPINSTWLAVCCCNDTYTLLNWTDLGWVGYFESGDLVTLRNERTKQEMEYLVEEVALDLVISREYAMDWILYGGDADFILEPNATITIEYNATVVSCGVDNNTFRAKGDWNCSVEGEEWIYSNEDKVTITVPCPGGYASDSGGTEQEVYYTDETVYATGSGFAPNSEVDIYITEDKHWVDGTHINSTIYAEKHDVTTDGNGSITGEEIWPNPDPGEYDIVYDTNNNMKFDLDVDAVDNENGPGFIVLGREQREQVPALTPVGIAALVAALGVVALSTIVRRKKR